MPIKDRIEKSARVGIHLLWMPSHFIDDHTERQPCDHPSQMIEEVGRRPCGRGTQILIQGTVPQLQNLLGDAEYYAGPDGPDEQPRGLKQAAKQVAAIVKQYLKETTQ